MSPATLQLINTILAALIIAVIIGLARWVQGKADKAEIADLKSENAKFEVKFEAAMLIISATITRPELAEKLAAIAGRADDRVQRMVADILQNTMDIKATAKAGAETDKKLDDLPSRVRALEDRRT